MNRRKFLAAVAFAPMAASAFGDSHKRPVRGKYPRLWYIEEHGVRRWVTFEEAEKYCHDNGEQWCP